MENFNEDLTVEKIEIMIGNGQFLEADLKKIMNSLILLDKANNALQKKQAITMLMSYLDESSISQIRVDEIVRYIEANNDLDNTTINLLNKYIGIFNDQEVKKEVKDEIWNNCNIIAKNAADLKVIDSATKFIENEGKEYAEWVLVLIDNFKQSRDKDEKEAVITSLKGVLEEKGYYKKRR